MPLFHDLTLLYVIQVSLKFVSNCDWTGTKPSTEPMTTLRWHHNGHDSVSNHQPHDCLLNRLFRRRWKKTSKLHVTGLCAGNSPGTGEFPAQMASNAENVSIWWRHHEPILIMCICSSGRPTYSSGSTSTQSPEGGPAILHDSLYWWDRVRQTWLQCITINIHIQDGAYYVSLLQHKSHISNA